MSSEAELLPCPFCGGSPFHEFNRSTKTHWIRCGACGAESDACSYSEDAHAAWNRRAPAAGACETCAAIEALAHECTGVLCIDDSGLTPETQWRLYDAVTSGPKGKGPTLAAAVAAARGTTA